MHTRRNKLNGYLDLIGESYSSVLTKMLSKYGPVSDDYFREQSYQRFLRGEIKSIAKGKYQRTSEGLYTHHMAENRYENISNLDYIRHEKYPFELQKKERLVYADLIEHLILHALIMQETDGQFGGGGYDAFLEPMVIDWFVKGKKPKPEWMKKAYLRAYLTEDETNILFKTINEGPLQKQNRFFECSKQVLNIISHELSDEWKQSTFFLPAITNSKNYVIK